MALFSATEYYVNKTRLNISVTVTMRVVPYFFAAWIKIMTSQNESVDIANVNLINQASRKC